MGCGSSLLPTSFVSLRAKEGCLLKETDVFMETKDKVDVWPDSRTAPPCAFSRQVPLACSRLANTAGTSGGSGFLSRYGLRAWHHVGCRPSQVRNAFLNHLLI